MLPVAFSNLLVAIAGMAVLVYAGLGLCHFLPRELAAYRLLVAPWAGYCVVVIVAQFLTNTPFAFTALQSTYFTLAAATPLNLYALWRWYKGREAKSVGTGIVRRETLYVGLLGVGVFILGVLPLWSYGYTTIIGENWDAEIYMGLGEYLKAYSQSGLTLAVPNPVLDTLINPPYSLRTHGFSYFQAGLGFLPLSSLETLAPLLALMHALAVPATYLFFRVVFRFRTLLASAASGLLGVNAFLLWITYNTFGMQVPALGLLPLTVCMAALALRRQEGASLFRRIRGASLLSGLLLAGTAITYHPALTALAAMLAPLVLLLLIQRRSDWSGILLNAFVITLTGALLSVVSQVKSFEGFLKQYSEKTNGLGLTGFTSPADSLGLSLSFRDLVAADAGRPLLSLVSKLYNASGWLALAVALLLILLYIYRLLAARPRAVSGLVQVALMAGALLYLLAFLRPLNYPYGWFKALSFVSFLPVGALLGGLACLGGTSPWQVAPTPLAREGEVAAPPTPAPRGKLRGVVSLAALLLFLAPLLATTWLTIGQYWGNPLRYDNVMLDAARIRTSVPGGIEGKSVLIAGSPGMQRLGRLYNGVLSYFFRGSDLYGDFQTANSKLDRQRPDGLYQYTLLTGKDDPQEYGVGNGTLAWYNPLLAFYSRAESGSLDLYHHNFRSDGMYPSVSAGSKPLSMTVSRQAISVAGFSDAPSDSGALGPEQFTLGLAAFTTSTLRIEWTGVAGAAQPFQEVAIPPGYTVYRAPGDIPYPNTVHVSMPHVQEASTPLYVRWAHLERFKGAPGQEPGVSSGGGLLMASVSSTRDADTILLDIGYLNNKPGVATQTVSLDIYGTGRGNSAHYGYWNYEVPGNTPTNLALRFDPSRLSLTPVQPDQALVLSSRFAGSTGDGSYSASLLVYENGSVSEAINDIFTFTLKDGKLAEFKSRSLAPLFR